MSDMLLAKQELPEDFIDLSIGEPHIMQDVLNKVYSLDCFSFNNHINIWQYPSPAGFKPLVDFLEGKYQAKVVITNGAKQGLAASLYAVKKSIPLTSLSKEEPIVQCAAPYWFSIPNIIKHLGMKLSTSSTPDKDIDCSLIVSPNNPDGHLDSPKNLKWTSDFYKERNIPLIHDAAYYTEVYIPEDHPIQKIGDMQVFSMSKMYGLSGIRLGYVVCHNEKYYKDLVEYQEATTVGVSTISQEVLLTILKKEKNCPELKEIFVKRCREELAKARKIISKINSRVLYPVQNPETVPGMFSWLVNLEQYDFTKVKVKVAPGEIFGEENCVRINLSVGDKILEEAVYRINSILDLK